MKKLLLLLLSIAVLGACSKDFLSESSPGQGVSGSITRFAVNGNYMYVLNQNEVQTYDITDRANPVLKHKLTTDWGLETITFYDNTLFLGSTTALYILDISNPAAPVVQAKSDRLSTVGFSGCDPVAVNGNYAYSTIKVIENICGIISAESALIVYDVSDKSSPKVLGTYPMSIPNGLGYKDNYLFVCDEGSDLLVVYDITIPAALQLAPVAVPMTDPYDLIVDGQRMIVSTKTDFQIFDVSQLPQIRKIGAIGK
ncbi:MAG: LVIVD repeat-containing protein [Bacteroidota bacterium]